MQVTSRTHIRKQLETFNRGEIDLEELVALTEAKSWYLQIFPPESNDSTVKLFGVLQRLQSEKQFEGTRVSACWRSHCA